MKIGNIIDSFPPDKSGSGGSVSGKGARTGSAASVKTETEQIRLSPLSAQVTSLTSDLKESAAFDAKRVAELKNTIEQGRYRINPAAIADRLIAHAADLAKPKNG